MIPEYDVFRIDNNGLTWIEPALTLHDALTRIQQRGAKEPGDYFVYDHRNRERIMLKVQGLRTTQFLVSWILNAGRRRAQRTLYRVPLHQLPSFY
jgi:hypothetical protein